MTTITAQVPDALAKELADLAERQRTTVDKLVSAALAQHVSDARPLQSMEERAKRGSWAKFDEIMAKIRDVPPLPGDER